MKYKKILIFVVFFCGFSLLYSQLTASQNYIYSKTNLSADGSKKKEDVTYYDGLGRPKQSVSIKSTPTGQDLVVPIVYDGFGRLEYNILPFPKSTANGGFHGGLDHTSGDSYYQDKAYAKKTYENSPLNRVLYQHQPGQAWSNNPIEYKYEANRLNEAVIKFTTNTTWEDEATLSELVKSGIYGDNTLYKNTVLDEDKNASIEYKNGEGQTLLVRKVAASENIDTYYVYNEYNQLAFVISPKASAIFNGRADGTIITATDNDLNSLCYQYKYDGKNRLVEKKLPGKGWEYMVYDQQDRLVLTQDQNLKLPNNYFNARGWLFTKYDQFGRVVYTGFFTNSGSRKNMQTALNSMSLNKENNELKSTTPFNSQGIDIYYNKKGFPTGSMKILSVNYYDEYPPGIEYLPTSIEGVSVLSKTPSTAGSASVSLKGLPVASFVKNIENDQWTKSYTYYDYKGRSIGSYTKNYLGGFTKVESKLRFSGSPEYTKTYHSRASGSADKIITETFVYDHQERMVQHKHKVGTGPEVLLTENLYNEIGQLDNKNVGDRIENTEYKYNIRGWITDVNNADNLSGKLFAYKMHYDTISPVASTRKYNGNISQIFWQTATDKVKKAYTYSYDQLNRLTDAKYWDAIKQNSDEFSETLSYDFNGNIKTLKRMGGLPTTNTTAPLNYDDLEFNIQGNRLMSVKEKGYGSKTLGYPLAIGDIGIEYGYDLNGNMTSQQDKGINKIVYNHLNLPNKITGTLGTTDYIYRADGTKVTKVVGTKSTDYLDGFQYVDGVLQFAPTAEGYYDFVKNTYIYNYVDHLGNVRLSYTKNSAGVIEILEENNYYPFGLKHDNSSAIVGNSNYNYKYSSQELQETGFYAMGWRHYAPDIGRFITMDKLSELAVDYTPFHFANNNPILYSDPTGLYTRDANGNISTSNPDEISELTGYFRGGGSVNGVDKFISCNPNFALDIPELVLSGSRINKFFTGNYFSGDNIKSVYNHLNKHIGSMATISQWDGDRGFFGNLADSKTWYKQLSYDLINGWYLGAQVVDFDLLGNDWKSPTGARAYTNIDGTPQYTEDDRLFGFLSIIPNGLTAETKLVEAGILKPLNASQFSKTFKGNLSRLSPGVRGYLNRKLNKVIKYVDEQINSSGFFMDRVQEIGEETNNKK